MPQTRRTAKGSPVKLQAELESVRQLAESHRRKIETHQRQIALEEQRLNEATKKAKQLEERRLEEEKAAERRKNQEETELKKTKKDERAEKLRSDADLPWERMSGRGVCERCQHHDIDCYRVIESADTRRGNPKARSRLRVQIGASVYSRCQECRVRDRKCAIVEAEEVQDDPQASQRNLNSNTLGSKKRKRGASPAPTVRTRSKFKLEGVVIEQPLRRLPIPEFRAIPGSSSQLPIQLGTPGPSRPIAPGSQKLQALEIAVATIQEEQRATKECLESIMGRLGIQNSTIRKPAGGSSRQAKKDRDMSYVSGSE